jgi:hypothetical protein
MTGAIAHVELEELEELKEVGAWWIGTETTGYRITELCFWEDRVFGS